MHGLTEQLAAGHLNPVSILVWTILSILVAVVAGVISGILLAGKTLGNDLAAAMGAMFGPVAVAPAVLVGLMLLAFL
jgi:hypothetical protein